MGKRQNRWIDDASFAKDIHYLEKRWRRTFVGTTELSIIDAGRGEPLVFVPMLEHFEFVYARQLKSLSTNRRVILYRRPEMRAREIGRGDRAIELLGLLDGLGLERPDLLAHGSAAVVLLEFALRYPQRCRSLILIAQGATYQVTPYPFTHLLQELYLRLPLENVLPDGLLRQVLLNYLLAHSWENRSAVALPRHLLEQQFHKIYHLPSVYKYSILPVLYNFDIRRQLQTLTMPTLLINRSDDPLAPESTTRWMAEQLPRCAGYHIVPGREHFFTYSQAEIVTSLIESFLTARDTITGPLGYSHS